MGANIGEKSENYKKKGMLKMMLKFEASKNRKNDFSINPVSPKGPFLGGPGGRGADFRRYLADFIRNLTRSAPRRGAAEVFAPKTDLGSPRVD